MDTPIGPLGELDLRDPATCEHVLSRDKHRLVEGLVFEGWLDRCLAASPGQTVELVDAETAIVRLPRQGDAGERVGAFVFARHRNAALDRYLDALGRRMQVWLVAHDPARGGFFAARVHGNGRKEAPSPLHAVTREVSGRKTPNWPNPTEEVRRPEPTKRIVREVLSEWYGDRLGPRLVLPRIFLNWGIQPWFDRVWNVDRALLMDGRLWHIEIKHKYPYQLSGRLHFGLNVGELRVTRDLGRCGLRSFYLIVTKPVWNKETSPVYLQDSPQARENTAIIGRDLEPDDVTRLLASEGGVSGSDTSFDGRSAIPYRPLPASGFRQLGLLSRSLQSIASRLRSQMTGQDQPLCDDAYLLDLCMERRCNHA